jgi:tetratricopeptide (TPR) repeat protein
MIRLLPILPRSILFGLAAAVLLSAQAASADAVRQGPVATTVQGIDAARAAFTRGDFVEAIAVARLVGTAQGAALAARAGLAQGDFIASPATRRSIFQQAEMDARLAIARDPQDPEGHLYLALALGFLGRLDGTLAAHFAGYAEEARQHIDRALALAPESAWAHALSGGWNLEIVRDGGMLGETLYGASLDKGIAAYRRALELEGGNTAIAYQYALQLLALGGAPHRAEALRELANALKTRPEDAAPEDAVEVLARRRAQRLKLALDTHDDLTLKNILRVQLGEPSSVGVPGLRTGGVSAPTGSPR